jgi:hypothetical protein
MKLKAKDVLSSNWLPIGCLLALALPCVWSVALLIGKMTKASRDIQKARDEIKNTADPEELRAWVWNQSRMAPQGRDFQEAIHAWPSQLPQLAKKGRAHLYPSHGSEGAYDSEIAAYFIWEFFDQSLKVVVRLNPDGTPANDPHEEYLPPEQRWVKGITFYHLHR